MYEKWQSLTANFLAQEGTELDGAPLSMVEAKKAADKLNQAVSEKRLGKFS